MLKFVLIIFATTLLASPKDVDELLRPQISSSAIISTQTITIPGYPRAYNPSLIPYKNGYLLSFRYRAKLPDHIHQNRIDASFVGLAQLDQKLQPLPGTVQLLQIQSYDSQFSLTAEDARLVLIGKRTFIIFNDLHPHSKNGFALYLAELTETKQGFSLLGKAKFLNYPFATTVEKNWSPFLVGEDLYLIYSDNPRTILKCDIETGDCEAVATSNGQLNWNWGIIRGGTPAICVADFYLTFFHSSFPANISKKRAYVMGAYLFDQTFPFTIRHATPNPLAHLSDYEKDNEDKIIFPGGIVIRENNILVTWGKCDKSIQITTFDKAKLFQSMGL